MTKIFAVCLLLAAGQPGGATPADEVLRQSAGVAAPQQDADELYAKVIDLMDGAAGAEQYRRAYGLLKKLEKMMPEEPDVHYRLAVCCEALAAGDGLLYAEALEQYRKCLELGGKFFDEEYKAALREKIGDMEYAVSLVAKNTPVAESLSGEWLCYNASGKREENSDIRISGSDGDWSVTFTSYKMESNYWESLDAAETTVALTMDGTDMSYDSEYLYICVGNPRKRNQYEMFKFRYAYHFELELRDGELVGTRKCTGAYSAMGSERFKTCEEAIARGKGRVDENCTGNCGSRKVYFKRKTL